MIEEEPARDRLGQTSGAKPMGQADFTSIASEHLVLRRFKETDIASFVAYRNDPEVARYQSWESCTEREAAAMIEELRSLRLGTPGEWFQFAIELKRTGALIGDCALKVEEQDARQAEIGFTLSRGYQGQGYASEAVSRLLDYSFDELWAFTGSLPSPNAGTPLPSRCSDG